MLTRCTCLQWITVIGKRETPGTLQRGSMGFAGGQQDEQVFQLSPAKGLQIARGTGKKSSASRKA
jgi:hypothetical protein